MTTQYTDKPLTPEQMFVTAKALIAGGTDPAQLIDASIQWRDKWAALAERVEAGENLDGRASIYTGETYAEAATRWEAYRRRLIEHIRGTHGGC